MTDEILLILITFIILFLILIYRKFNNIIYIIEWQLLKIQNLRQNIIRPDKSKNLVYFA